VEEIMHFPSRVLSSFFFLLIIGTFGAGRATTVMRVPLDEMVRGSDLIVMAEVTDISVTDVAEDVSGPFTKVRLKVSMVLKGHHSAPFLTLRLRGGSSGPWTLRVPGTPGFEKGEEVVLFLESTGRGYVPAGLSLGKFTVTRDTDGSVRVKRLSTGAMVVNRTDGGRVDAETGPVSHMDDEMRLKDLLDVIYEALERQGGAK